MAKVTKAFDKMSKIFGIFQIDRAIHFGTHATEKSVGQKNSRY